MPKSVISRLPAAESPNIIRYYLITACMNSFFISSVWMFFWLKVVGFRTLGIIEWVSFASAWMADIPSGVIADRVGRKPVIIIAIILSGSAVVTMGFMHSSFGLLVTNTLLLVGYSLYSGVGEALAYDSLPAGPERSSLYQRVVAVTWVFDLTACSTAVVLGAWLYRFWPPLPFLMQGVTFLIGLVIAFGYVEPSREIETKSERPSYREILLATLAHAHGPLRGIMTLAFTVAGTYYFFSWGYLRPAMAVQIGMDERQLAIFLVAGLTLGMVAIFCLNKIRSLVSDPYGLGLAGIFFGIAFVLGPLFGVLLGGIAMVLIMGIGNLYSAWISILVNQQIAPKERATVLSSIAFITKIPYCLMAWWGGVLLENHYGPSLFAGLGVFAMIGATVGFYQLAKNVKN